MPHPLTLEPEGAAVALHHVAHREGAAFAGHRDGIGLPAHHGLGAHGLADPHQVQLRALALRLQAQLDHLDLVFVHQPPGQVGQRLQQAEAVHLQPQLRIHVAAAGAAAEQLLDAACGGLHQVGTTHVLQRPAGLERLGGVLRHLLDALAHRRHLVAHHGLEAAARVGVELGVVQQLHRRLQVAQ